MDDSLLEAPNPFGNHQKWSPVKQFIFWRGSNHIYIYDSVLGLGQSFCQKKFRSQTSYNMDRWKSRGGKSQREKSRREKIREEKGWGERRCRCAKGSGARKGSKVAKHCVFAMICGPAGPKSRLAKAAGAEPFRQMGDGKLHAVVARSTFQRQNAQNISASEQF